MVPFDIEVPFGGSCLCGAVDYTCTAEPVWSVHCHCTACRKLSGAPYVSAFSVPSGSFACSGPTVAFTRTSEAGHIVTTTHCSQCGTRVHAQSAGATMIRNVFASTLANPGAFKAISNVYLSEAAPWIDPPPARFNFQKMPSFK